MNGKYGRTNMNWQQERVFVTGAEGLLGSHLVQELLHRGSYVCCLIRDINAFSPLRTSGHINHINQIFGGLQDYLLMERILNEYEITTVFHLAAQAIVGIGNNNPLSTFESNIQGTWNVLEASRRNQKGVRRVIMASSDKAYGEQLSLPYTEDMPLKGCHPYDVSKSCADLIAQTYAHTYKLPVCITRCGNLFGGGDLNFSRIVPGTIRSILQDENPIIRSDGTWVRDYLYVNNAVSGYMCLAEKMLELDLKGQAFNLSHEMPLSVKKIVEKILCLMGCQDLEPRILATAYGEIQHQYLSAQKARHILSWEPNIDFESGLIQTIQWYEDYFQHKVLV